MRFLLRTHDAAETSRIRSLLESNGILCHIQSDQRFVAGYRQAVFVCLDDQYDDARELLRNPEHRVANPLDASAYQKFSEGFGHGHILAWSVLWLVAAALFLILAVWISID